MTHHPIADLHVHPTLYSFNRLRNTPEEADPSLFHPWNTPPSNLARMARGKRARDYAQSDFAKMVSAGVRLPFVSLTPIEKQFFLGEAPEQVGPRSWRRRALRLATGVTPLRALVKLAREGGESAQRELLGILRSQGPFRRALARRVMNYSAERIAFLSSLDYDYWEELQREYDFLRAADGVVHEVDLELPGEGVRPVQGVYEIVRDRDHLESLIEAEPQRLACVLTIEGGHVFSIGPNLERVGEEVLFERIEALKAWPHPIFFLTLAHHFDNGLCGHAHSIPELAGHVIDQRRRMGAGLEAEGDLGDRAIRALLDLDEDLAPRGGRAILIDCKHMSPLARRQYYERIVRPHNRRVRRGDFGRDRPLLPVIFSHAAYAGVATLDELIEQAPRENDRWSRRGFNAWGLNVADEDIRMVFETEGLYGLVFEQRVMGLGPARKVPPDQLAHVVLEQILAVVDAIMLDDEIDEDRKPTIWERICLGTDYDGFIDPLSRYPTACQLPTLAEDLRELLGPLARTRWIGRIGIDTLVRKLMWENAVAFARRHVPA